MNSENFKEEARRRLSGKWGKAALIVFLYVLLFFVIELVCSLIPEDQETLVNLVSLVVYIIEIPLSFGLLLSFFNLYNGLDTKVTDFFTCGFSNFKRAWSVLGRIFLKLWGPILLLAIAIVMIFFSYIGFIVPLSYSITSDGPIPVVTIKSSFYFLVILFLFSLILYVVAIIWSAVKSLHYSLSYIIAADKPELSAKEAVEKSRKLMDGNRWRLFKLYFSFIGWAILSVFTFGIGFLFLLPYMRFSTFAFYKSLVASDKEAEKEELVYDNVQDNGPISE